MTDIPSGVSKYSPIKTKTMRQEKILCRGCDQSHETNPDKWVDQRYDAYGYSTGYWCETCYEGDKYPYRRDRYHDYMDAGEYLEDDY